MNTTVKAVEIIIILFLICLLFFPSDIVTDTAESSFSNRRQWRCCYVVRSRRDFLQNVLRQRQASLSLDLETKACPFPSGSSGSDYPSNLPSFLKPFTCLFIHVFVRSFIYSFILVYFTGREFSSIHFHLFLYPTGIGGRLLLWGLCAQHGNHPLNKTLPPHQKKNNKTLPTILKSFLPSRRSELFG